MAATKPISDADKLATLAGQIGQVHVLATNPTIAGTTAANDLMGLPLRADLQQVREALYSGPPPKGRGEWLPLIFAVHAALGQTGYQMARDWSASDPEKFDPIDFDKVWNSFDPTRPGGIGAGTLFHWARANGYSPSAAATAPSTGAASLLAQQPSTVAGKLRRAEVRYDVVHVPEWVIDGFNASAEITVFAGLPGVGKSTAIAALVMAVAGFGSAIGSTLPVRRTRTVALVSEHSAQYGRIFAAYCYKFSIDPEQLQDRVVCHDAQRLVKQEVAAELTYLVGQHTEEDPPLIVLDTASATFELDDENSNAEVAGMVAEVKNVVTATGAPVWIIAHAAKTMARTDADVLPRGASAFIGDAHATAAVFQDDHSPDCTFIKPIKLRHERTFDEIEVQTQAIRLQGINARGETSPVVDARLELTHQTG